MDNRFPILETCIGHVESFTSNIFNKHLQIVILHFLVMILLQFSKLSQSMQPKSTTVTYKYVVSLILTCIECWHITI
jgi:hypothetical protein